MIGYEYYIRIRGSVIAERSPVSIRSRSALELSLGTTFFYADRKSSRTCTE